MAAAKDKRGRSKLGRLFRALRLVVVVVLVLLSVAGALAWWRLSRGPISLDRFTGTIQELVDGEIAPLSLELGGADLVWHGWGGPLEVRVREVGLRKEDGDPLVAVGGAALAVAKAPLLRGTIAPVWLTIDGVNATVVRGEDGRIDLGLPETPEQQETPEQPDAPESPPPDLAELADRWLAPPDPDTPLGRLTTIGLRDANLRYEDRVLDLAATADHVDIELERGEALLEVSIPLAVEIDDATIELSAGVIYRLDQGSIQARVDVPALEPARLARLDPGLEVLSALDLSLALHAEAEISEALELESGEVKLGGDWGRVLAQVTFIDGLETLDGRVQITDLEPWRFAGLAPEVERLERFRHPLNAEIFTALEGGVMRSGNFRLQGGEGSHDWGEISAQVEFAAAVEHGPGNDGNADSGASLIGDTLTGQVRIDRLKPWMFAGVSEVEELRSIRLPLALQAEAALDRGALQSARLALQAGAGSVRVGEIYDEPLRVLGLELEASAQDGLDTVRVERLAIDLVDLQPRIVAQAIGRDGRYDVRAAAKLERIPLDRLETFWPGTVADDVEEWITENIPEGTVRDVVFEVAMDLDLEADSPVQNEVLSGSMAFEGLVLDLLAPKPPVEGIGGTATFEDWTLAFDVTGGRLRDLEIEGADVAITGLDGGQDRLAVDLLCSVEVATALELLSGEPLDVLQRDELSGLNGKTEARLQLGLNLSGEDDDLVYTAHAKASEVLWTDAPLGLEVTEGELAVDVSADAVEVQGTAKASGMPTTIEFRQDLADGDPRTVVHARVRIDEQGLLALGLPEQPFLSGTTGLDLRFTLGADDLADIDAELNFHDSEIDIRELDWHKPPGEDGGATIIVRQQSERAWSVEHLDLTAADAKVTGTSDFKLDPFALERIDVTNLELIDNQIRASLHRREDDGYRVRVSGTRFNLEPVLERLRSGGVVDPEELDESVDVDAVADTGVEDDGRAPFDVAIQFDQFFLSPEARLDGFEATTDFDGQHVKTAAISATVEPEGSVSLTYGPSDDGYRFELSAESAGEVLAALASGDAKGGTVVITGTGPSEAGPFEGRVTVRKVRLVGQPVLARILSLASLSGLLANLSGEGLMIRKGRGDFTLDQGVVTLHGARIDGAGFLISLRGTADFPEKRLDLRGAVAPLGKFQRILGMIPLIGRIVTGWNKEGLIATEFTVRGPFDDVDTQVVPLSTVTPGILRDVFRVFGRGGGKKVDDQGADADDKAKDSDEDDKSKGPESG